MNANWILGFIEGEGCFQIRASRNKNSAYGFIFSPSFSISQSIKNKKAIIKMAKFIGVGSTNLISHHKQRTNGKKHQDEYRFMIVGIKSCKKLRHLLYNLDWQTTKKKEFEAWSEAIDLLELGAKTNSIKRIKKIISLRDKIATRTNNMPRPKTFKTKEYILNIIKNLKPKHCKVCGKKLPKNYGNRKHCSKHGKRFKK